MGCFGSLDAVALLFFVGAWRACPIAVACGPHGGCSLNSAMNLRRRSWCEQALTRENRSIDTQVMSGLQNGTAFVGPTSLLAVGGCVTLLRVTGQMMQLTGDLPFVGVTTQAMRKVKVIGLVLIFADVFFRFARSHRLFNCSAIVLGTLPPAMTRGSPAAQKPLDACVSMKVVAGRSFNQGQRAFFFAQAYLGWILGPLALALFTAAVLLFMWNRQFDPDSLAPLGPQGDAS